VTAKEYLQEIRKLDLYINQKQTEYDALYKLRGGAGGIDYAQERVQTCPDGQGFTKISDGLVDLQKEINAQIDRFYNLRNERIDQIQQMDKPEHTDILFRRYVQYESFERISYDMGYSYKSACNLHGAALTEFFYKFLKDVD